MRHAPSVTAAMMVKAWNGYTRGDSMLQLSWRVNQAWPRIFDPEGEGGKIRALVASLDFHADRLTESAEARDAGDGDRLGLFAV